MTKPNDPPIQHMLDCAFDLGCYWKEVVYEEDDKGVRGYCCPEMEALLAISNGVVEAADSWEELREMIQDADHVELRREIAAHECVPEFYEDIARCNPALAKKWLEAYRES